MHETMRGRGQEDGKRGCGRGADTMLLLVLSLKASKNATKENTRQNVQKQ